MLKGYLSKRLLVISATAVCIALATPTILRRWMIDHLASSLDIPVSIGNVSIYPRSGTLHATDITLGDENGPAYFKIAQSWLTWKNDSWSDGALRFRRAILDDVQIETDLASHNYFGVFAQLQTQRSGELIPSIYNSDVSSASSEDLQQHLQSTHTTLVKYRDIWNQSKKKLNDATTALHTALALVEKNEQLSPNSLRAREELQNTMNRAIEARRTYLQAKVQVLSFADQLSQIESEIENKQAEDLQKVTTELHLDEQIFRDLSERILKEHTLAQTSMWLDYVATGRTLLSSMQMPELASKMGTDFHFAHTAPESKSLIDELTLKGSISLHHRAHDLFLRGYNLRSYPEPKSVTRFFADAQDIAKVKPTVLRGEIKSRGQSLLFDFRRLWENRLQATSETGASLPRMVTTSSEVITMESPSVGPTIGEMKIGPSVYLAWQGRSPWVWSQWRFDENDKWRAKWVIRQSDLRFYAQNAADGKSTETAKLITDYVSSLDRIDVEMDITCIENQYAVTVTSNLDEWLPQVIKMIYRAEEQSQLERVRTAIQQRKDQELSLLRSETKAEKENLASKVEPALSRLEKLSTALASKIGVSPRVMLSQESESEVTR